MKKLIYGILFLLFTYEALPQPDPDAYFAISRLNYYTNEEVGEILVYVPERLKDHKITIDLVFEYQVLNRGYQVASNGVTTVPFSLKLLREGQNEITVSFFEDDKWIDSRKIFVTLRAHRENAVKIEKVNGGLFTGGLLLMPFGFSTDFPVNITSLDQEAAGGFNMISPFQDLEKKSFKQRKAYMDRCADLGMRVNYNLCCDKNMPGIEGETGMSYSVKEKAGMIRKEVELFRDHPALLSWFIADKPDGRGVPADSLLELCNMVRELDPYHPVTLLLGSPRNAGQYKDVTDIFMTAPFPIPQGKLQEVADYTRIPKQQFLLEKPVWVVTQAYGGDQWYNREPDPREVRAMTYMAVINGATGIQYFIRSASCNLPRSRATWNECAALSLEMAELTPDILSPYQAPDVSTDQTGIHAKAWNRSGLVTVAVVNCLPDPASFKLKFEDLDLTIKAQVMFENRGLVVVDGVIEDLIEGLGTRVYRFDARHKPDQVKGFQHGNITFDPGFEDITTTGLPAYSIAFPGTDPGCTYFIDSRRHFEGDHSLRVNNPSVKPGNRLSFLTVVSDPKKSYTISVMAKTGFSSNKPGVKKGGTVQFRLTLGNAEKIFECTDSWQSFQVNGVRMVKGDEASVNISPQIEMISKGTAWFDLLQVFPDMEIIEHPGTTEKLRNIELKCFHPDSKIFYTTDGSEPTQASAAYLVPVEIDNSTVFKAKAFISDQPVGYIER